MRLLVLFFLVSIVCVDVNAQKLRGYRDSATNLVGFKDSNGNVVVQPRYSQIADSREGYTQVSVSQKWGFIDSTGKEIIPPMYESASLFYYGMARAQKDGKWGWIDKQNKTVIPFIYDKASSFNEGLARVKKDRLYGYIDAKGKTVIPFTYANAEDFRHGQARVKRDDRTFYIDRKGKVIQELVAYEEVVDEAPPVVEMEIRRPSHDGEVEAPPPVQESEPEVYTFVEQMPSFPGGDAALMQYLKRNVAYPQAAVESNIQGKVWVQMVVAADGSVGNVTVVRGVHGLLDKEAMRVVKAMPKWTPGKQNGKSVSVRYTLPVNFVLK